MNFATILWPIINLKIYDLNSSNLFCSCFISCKCRISDGKGLQRKLVSQVKVKPYRLPIKSELADDHNNNSEMEILDLRSQRAGSYKFGAVIVNV